MNTLGPSSLKAGSLVVAASLVLFAGGMYASGPAGGGGGANVSAGGATVGGGFSGAGLSGGSRGGGRVSGPTISGARPAISGARPGVSFSNNSSLARGTAFRNVGAPSTLSLPYRNVTNPGINSAVSRTVPATASSRPANSWSGLAVNPANTAAASRAAIRSTYRPNGWTANRFTGQRLSPGAPGSNLPTYNQGDYGRGRGGNNPYRLRSRYYYYPYAYGPTYAPYISYFGGGYYGDGSYFGAYPYSNEVPVPDTSYENSNAATVSPQYTEQAPVNSGDSNEQQPDASQQPVPQRQAQPDANRGTIPNNGPDSLVEAVQEELVRRGYFGGKVDAMFNADTKEALRKFQTDHHLAATGLINEATLHALQLD